MGYKSKSAWCMTTPPVRERKKCFRSRFIAKNAMAGDKIERQTFFHCSYAATAIYGSLHTIPQLLKAKSGFWIGFNCLSNENEWLIDFVDAMAIKVGYTIEMQLP